MIKQGSLETGTSYSIVKRIKSGNGVGIALSNSLRDSTVGIKRTSDRIMVVKLCWQGKMVNILSAYAPQVGCSEEEKDVFLGGYG